MEPIFPEVRVKLTGKDGNAWNILGIVSQGMKAKKIPKEKISEFTSEAMAGDYDHLLRTCMKWVEVV